MIYIIFFIVSIFLNLLTDKLLFILQTRYSFFFYSFFIFFFNFICLFLWKKKIGLNKRNISRATLCSLAFLLTFQAYKTNVNLVEISSMYYTIPVFECIIFMFLRRKFNINSFISLFFNIMCFFLFSNGKIPMIGVLGCFFFSVSDLLIISSEDPMVDILSVSFFISLIFFFMGFLIEGKEFFKYSLNNPYMWLAATTSLITEILVFYSYKNEDPLRLSPFRYIDLLCLNVSNFGYKLFVPLAFMIIKIII